MRIFIQTVTRWGRSKIFREKYNRKLSAAATPTEEIEPGKEAESPSLSALVKSRPAHLAKRSYVLIDNSAEVDALFFRLRDSLFKSLGIDLAAGRIPVGNRIRAEVGSLHGQRPYFFLDPWEENGWLIEKTPTGFLIAPADKIVERDTFMRGSAWDVVNIFKPDRQDGLYRLSSQRCGDKLMSLALYQDYLVKELKLADYTHHRRVGM